MERERILKNEDMKQRREEKEKEKEKEMKKERERVNRRREMTGMCEGDSEIGWRDS
jgi:hypothetical protein